MIAAADFFTVEAWTPRGLVMHYVTFVIHHATRAVQFAGVTTNPSSALMAQIAKNLTDCVDGFLLGKRYLILDDDTIFTARSTQLLEDGGTKVVRTSLHAPNMNAIAERFVLIVKTECLNKRILFGYPHLARAHKGFGCHCRDYRPHQGLDDELITPRTEDDPTTGDVVARERPGGLLSLCKRSGGRRAIDTGCHRPRSASPLSSAQSLPISTSRG